MGLGGAGNPRMKDLITPTSSDDFLHAIDLEFEYHFLTFDNQSFGYSFSSGKCFDKVLDSMLWEQRMGDLSGVMNTHDGEGRLGVRIAAARVKGELCLKQSEEIADIRRHMTTVYAVRDMSEILKGLPELSSLFDSSSGRSEEGKIPKLKFMGLSYRTMVVQTLAILYPEHVSRMVLDGTGNAKDWVDKWQMGYLIDIDATWASFYDGCFEAKEACPLWRAHDSASTDIENCMTDFLENLKQRPVYAHTQWKCQVDHISRY